MEAKDFPIEGSCFEHTKELYDYICKIRPNVIPKDYDPSKKGMAWSKYGLWFVTEVTGKPRFTLKELETFYKPDTSSYKGDIEGFPKEVVDKMLHYQVCQGSFHNIKAFEHSRYASKDSIVGYKGFNWMETPEGNSFWQQVIGEKKFHVFFEKYPKQQSEEDLLEKAKTMFYQGVTFNNSKAIKHSVGDYKITGEPRYYMDEGDVLVHWSDGSSNNFTLYRKGIWADVISTPDYTEPNITPSTFSELMKHAEKHYPEGTKYKALNMTVNRKDEQVSTGRIGANTTNKTIWVKDQNGYLYWNGKWAEVIPDYISVSTGAKEPLTIRGGDPNLRMREETPYVTAKEIWEDCRPLTPKECYPVPLEEGPVLMKPKPIRINKLINFNK